MKTLTCIGLAVSLIVAIAVAAGMFIIFGVYLIARFCAGYGWNLSDCFRTDEEILAKGSRIRGIHYEY